MNKDHPLLDIKEEISNQQDKYTRDDRYRDEIRDLFRDYRHPWDILTELVQNSVDAINDDESEIGNIEVKVDTDKKELTVSDNGVGVRSGSVEKILVPNFSEDKSSGRTYGYKGVGLSFVSHLSKIFHIETVRSGEKIEYKIENNIEWAFGEDGSSIKKRITGPNQTDEESRTSVSIKLDADYGEIKTLRSLNDFFEWASDYKVLEYILRTKTAVGNTRKFFGKEPIKEIDVSIQVDDNDKESIEYKYLSPFGSDYSKESRFFLKEKVDGRESYESVYTDSTRRDKDKIFRCLRHDVFGLRVGKQQRTRTDFDLSVHVCGETGLTELEDEYNVRSLSRSIVESFKTDTGIYVSINGMPTPIQLHNYTGGFKKRFFCIIDADIGINDELDKGRKGISEHTKNLIISKVSKELKKKVIEEKYSMYQAARRMKETRSRGYAGSDVTKHLEKWDSLPPVIEDMLIDKRPVDENAVVALFGELAGDGILQGYKLRYISQDATFDFAFEHQVDRDRLDKHSYSISEGFVDTLGYSLEDTDGLLRGPYGQDWHIGEFKISAEDIVGSDDQPLEQLDLLVAWDFDEDELVSGGATITEATVNNRSYTRY